MNTAKLTIDAATALLAEKGIALIKVLPYDMKNMVAVYLVEEAGVQRQMTSKEIKKILS